MAKRTAPSKKVEKPTKKTKTIKSVKKAITRSKQIKQAARPAEKNYKLADEQSCIVVFGKGVDAAKCNATLSVWIRWNQNNGPQNQSDIDKKALLQLMPDSAKWSISVTDEHSSAFKVGQSYPVSIRSKGKGVRHGTVECTLAEAERADFKGKGSYDMPYSEMPS